MQYRLLYLEGKERTVVAQGKCKNSQRVKDVLPRVAVNLAQREPQRPDIFAINLNSVRIFSGGNPLPSDFFYPVDESEGDVDYEGRVLAPVRGFEVEFVVGDGHCTFVGAGRTGKIKI